MNIKIVLFLVLFFPYSGFAQDNLGKIEVVITGFKSSSGKAGITLFSSEKGFPMKGELAVEKLFADIEQSSCTVVLRDIPYGTYAVSVFHDENSNGKLDTNMIGMPKEGVGSSNNAKGRFGPPRYKDASFVLDSNKKQMNIYIQYLRK
jgi:uncharacterized protein (DUF2141 family)